MFRTHHAVAIAATVALALSGCTGSAVDPPASVTPAPSSSALGVDEVEPTGARKVVASGLDAPWSVILDGDGALVSERDSADILQLRASGALRVVGTVPGVAHGGEGGLLGLALDDQHRLYVYSTGDDGNRIQRFALAGPAGTPRLGRATTILDGLPAQRVHNGGRIAFGPDGMLYASVGDATNRGSAQDLDELSGKILRMTPDGDVPDDNPFDGSLVYSYGHRNVQGLGWAEDGTMFASEFGQDTWDELNIIEPGANYGWPIVEGKGGGKGLTDPVQQWPTDDASPSGLAVLGGTVFIANLQGERIRGVPVADPTTAREYFIGDYGRIRSVLEGPDGSLWFVTNNTDGRGSPREGDDRIVSAQLVGG
ncbi:PQQ-dependent sugar dehydrogenase [Lacisediminihabitans changchengi]|uniref:PQQ-dependent sugar dehydrogenase n=1 Tax=Lacisediminihabitans changchengi TaxID=2787634 RepID=A0A934SHB2_9MICO|nr:PQQ-dependent sugar dehydrogenase [Lacisediminihabitans changchengi]MBK4346672.1 PQQ-dependent sugar dehydrogenase [Lacisediminihabitans changchengi]